MAMLSFFAQTINDKRIAIKEILSYELNRDVDAACDGLRLTFCVDKKLDEIVKVEAYLDDEKVFNGYADTQRETLNSNGYQCFVYARSSACLLLDNEAKPVSYAVVSAESLALQNASVFGFVNKLPRLYSDSAYIVTKGTSCYGAINNFVKGTTDKNIVINANNEIILPSGNGVLNLAKHEVISEKWCTNRGGLVSRVDYKVEGDNGYAHHIKSKYLESLNVVASRKINLSSLPEWQRDNTAKNILLSACSKYHTVDVLLDGCVMPELYDRVKGKTMVGDLDGYYVTGICVSFDFNGERTKLSFSKDVELEEITYVAE